MPSSLQTRTLHTSNSTAASKTTEKNQERNQDLNDNTDGSRMKETVDMMVRMEKTEELKNNMFTEQNQPLNQNENESNSKCCIHYFTFTFTINHFFIQSIM